MSAVPEEVARAHLEGIARHAHEPLHDLLVRAIFLRVEHAIERDFRRIGFRRDGVDADAANAESIKQLFRRVEQAIARTAARVA